MVKLLLLAAAFTTEGTQQDWIDQLGAADRLVSENRHHEAELAYIAARNQAERFGVKELPMAITLNHMGVSDPEPSARGGARPRLRTRYCGGRLGTASPNAVKVALDLS